MFSAVAHQLIHICVASISGLLQLWYSELLYRLFWYAYVSIFQEQTLEWTVWITHTHTATWISTRLSFQAAAPFCTPARSVWDFQSPHECTSTCLYLSFGCGITVGVERSLIVTLCSPGSCSHWAASPLLTAICAFWEKHKFNPFLCGIGFSVSCF